MTAAKRTPLLRTALILSIAGTLALVLLISYVGMAVYYAAHLRAPNSGSSSVMLVGNDTVELREQVNLSDPGPFAIEGLTVVAQVELANGTPWITGASPIESIPGYGSRPVAIALDVPLGGTGSVAALLTNSTTLPVHVYVNASYASLVAVGIETNTTYHWGAPFDHLQVSPGVPTRGSNLTVAFPFSISFTDRASFSVLGNLTLALLGPSGLTCADERLPVAAASGQGYSETPTIYVPASCAVSGGAYSLSWSGSGFSVPLPGRTIP